MRVLHVATTMSPEAGGPPVTVRELAASLATSGVDCEVVSTVGARFRMPPLSIPGVPVHAFPATPLGHFWGAHSPALARFVRSNVARFDLIHVHELWHHPGFVAVDAARRLGIPYVVSIHGGLGGQAIRRKRVRKWVYMKLTQGAMLQSAAALHALTRFEAAEATRLGSPTVAVIPNGVSPDFVRAIDNVDTADLLRCHPELAGKRVILFLGRLTKTKGLDVLAKCFAEAATRYDDAHLLIVGPDKDGTQGKVARCLVAAGLGDRVTFTGALYGKDKLAAFACSDLFVLPSRMEGFSNALLEALAAGLPVVISEQCNFPEVAEHGAGVVAQNSDREVTGAICAFLEDERYRVEAGRNGRQMVMQRYTWSAIASAFVRLYSSAIASSKSGKASASSEGAS